MLERLPLRPLTRALPSQPAYKGSGRTIARCLAPWLDAEGDFSRVGVHSLTNGASVVDSADAFVTKVVELRGAGLSANGAFFLLRAFSEGHVTHLLRSNCECAGMCMQYRGIISWMPGVFSY